MGSRSSFISPQDENPVAECERLEQENTALKAELEPFRYLALKNRLLRIDYGYNAKSRDWKDAPFIRQLAGKLESGEKSYLAEIDSYASYIPQLKQIALHEKDCTEATKPFWLNDWIPGFDAISLYATVAAKNPQIYLEIGSGNSTKFVRQAIADHGLRTKIISIDPQPRAEIDQICDKVIRSRCEDADLTIFEQLSAGDILFVDNSHRSFMNSDVTVFFCEILGMLAPGVLYGLHDIHIPFDYPENWADRWYNEQYLLMMYLIGGAQGDKIIMPNYYISGRYDIRERLSGFYGLPEFRKVWHRGGIFWMERA